MATIRPKFLTPIQIDHAVVDYVVAPFVDGAIYTSGLINRSAAATFAELVTVAFTYDTGTPDGVVEIWVYGDYGAFVYGTYDSWAFSQPNQSASAVVDMYGAHISSIGAIKAGEINMVGVAAYEKRLLKFNVASVFGGAIPPRYAILVKNDSGVSVVGNGPNGQDAWCIIQGVQAETV